MNESKLPKCFVPYDEYKFVDGIRSQFYGLSREKGKEGLDLYNSVGGVKKLKYREISYRPNDIVLRFPSDCLLSEICDNRMGAWLCCIHKKWYWFHHKDWDTAIAHIHFADDYRAYRGERRITKYDEFMSFPNGQTFLDAFICLAPKEIMQRFADDLMKAQEEQNEKLLQLYSNMINKNLPATNPNYVEEDSVEGEIPKQPTE